MWEPRRCSDLNWILKNRNGFKVDWMWIEFWFSFRISLDVEVCVSLKGKALKSEQNGKTKYVSYKSSDEIKNMKQPQNDKIWNKFHTSFVYDVVVGSGAIKILNFKPKCREHRGSMVWMVGPNRATHGLEDVCRNGVRIQKKSLFHHKMAESCAEKNSAFVQFVQQDCNMSHGCLWGLSFCFDIHKSLALWPKASHSREDLRPNSAMSSNATAIFWTQQCNILTCHLALTSAFGVLKAFTLEQPEKFFQASRRYLRTAVLSIVCALVFFAFKILKSQ